VPEPRRARKAKQTRGTQPSEQAPPPRRAKPSKPPKQEKASRPPKPPKPPKAPKRPKSSRSLSARALTLLWFVVVLAAAGALVVDLTSVPVPFWVPVAGSVTVTTAYTVALGVRAGGRPLLAGLLALALTALAAISMVPVLLAAAAVSTAAAGAVLGVLATKPAARFREVVREVLVATAVAAVAALAADGYGARLSLERSGYLALALALLTALALVFRLGAGFQGLGTRGAVVVVGGLGLLAVTLAYAEALSRWGSPEMIASIDEAIARVREGAGAVPRPIEFLLGFPALAWGVSTRARRRQGWWACAFGAAGLAGVSTTLISTELDLQEAALGVAYGLVLGLFLGYLVIRVDTFLSGTRGARARRAEEAAAHRPEPARTAPLL
jgi:hypothetical protein